MTARFPPGRAGRMRLRGRLETAERGRDQLDRKLRLLIPELERLQTRRHLRQLEWDAAMRQARTWLLRAVLLGGQDAIRAATPDQFAQVAVTWTSTMGLRYPDDVVITSADATTTPNNAATVPATDAFRAALLAGSRVAATGEAIRRLEAEIGLTRRRLRALDKRLIPWLRAELAALELTLEQSEQEDGMRLRRAVANGSEGRTDD